MRKLMRTFSGALRFAGPLAQTATLGVLHDTISSDRFSRRRGQHAGRQRRHSAGPEGPSRAHLWSRCPRALLAGPGGSVRRAGLSRLYRRPAALPRRTPAGGGVAVDVVIFHGLPLRLPGLPRPPPAAESAAQPWPAPDP